MAFCRCLPPTNKGGLVKQRFSEAEARAKVGQRVRAWIEWPGLTKGATGTVVDIFHVGDNSFEVIIQWDVPHPNRPCGDWFTKSEYEVFLEEIE